MLYSEEETLISGLLPEHVSVKDFEKSVQKGTATGGRLSESVEIPLSSGLKKVLKYAADEAEKMASMQVESKHLLIFNCIALAGRYPGRLPDIPRICHLQLDHRT